MASHLEGANQGSICQPRARSTHFATCGLFSLLLFFHEGKSVSAVNEQLILHELMIFEEKKEEKLYRF